MKLFEIKNLKKEFSRGENKFMAVNGVDFSVDAGDNINIVGRSGSGKTTFLNLISGILNPTEGDITFEGRNLKEFSDLEMSQFRNKDIGYVPQGLGTMPNIDVLDNIRLPYFLMNREGNGEERARILMEMLEISHLKNQMPKNLSGGELRRVLIARAMMNEPKILIADEPTADLDIQTTKKVMEIFSKINEKGTALILVTHELDTLTYGEKIYTMDGGKLTEGNNLL